MKALKHTGVNQIALVDVAEPQPGYGQIKIKVAYAALCATDVHIVTQGLYNRKPGNILGHEVSGTVAEFGPGTENVRLKMGDKVVVGFGPCGVCDPCQRGNEIFCENRKRLGGFAEYVVTDANSIFKVPDDADLSLYCLVEPSTCALRCIDISQIKTGETVAVSGVGGIGSIILNMVLLSGGARVTAIDPVKEKRELAMSLGASYTINPAEGNLVNQAMEITGGRGFDIVIETSGLPIAAPPVLNMIAGKGRAIFFGVYPMDYELPVNLFKLFQKEAKILTVFTSVYNYPRVIDLFPRMQMQKIVGKIMPLSEIVEAFEIFHKSIYPKIVIKCSDFE
jgi:threonine dehydrogenase-like Zn-dependent dehydrogenase